MSVDRVAPLLLSALFVACGGTVTATPGSDASTPDDGVDAPVIGDPTVTGTWTGYIESYKFPSGSDALKMVLTGLPDGTVTGTLILGNKPAPPPPTNPEVGYPPDLRPLGGPSATGTFWGEGFVHTVLVGKLTGKRLTFKISNVEVFKAWCELQTVIYDGGPSALDTWWCLPNWGYSCCGSTPAECTQTNPATKEVVLRDCGKLYLCAVQRVCNCTATKCSTYPDGNVSFDIAIAGDDASGSTTGRFGDKNVHFTRVK